MHLFGRGASFGLDVRTQLHMEKYARGMSIRWTPLHCDGIVIAWPCAMRHTHSARGVMRRVDLRGPDARASVGKKSGVGIVAGFELWANTVSQDECTLASKLWTSSSA